MFILSYFHIIVNIRALLPFIICKASYFFDFLINAPYFIEGILLFAELIKLVYDKRKNL